MKSALIVYGGWSGHEPEECAAIYRRWLHEDGFSVRMATETSAFADPSIHDLSLIVPIFTMSKIEKAEVENLVKAVENGVGLAGHHGGMSDAFRDAVEYQFMVGGQWVAHPGNIIDYTVDVADPLDPIMAGIKAFRYTSEQYTCTLTRPTMCWRRQLFPVSMRLGSMGSKCPSPGSASMARAGCFTRRWAIRPRNSRTAKWPPCCAAA